MLKIFKLKSLIHLRSRPVCIALKSGVKQQNRQLYLRPQPVGGMGQSADPRTMSRTTLNFAETDALGFDMDFTLARYHLVPFHKMTFDIISNYLIKEKNYDAAVFKDLEKDKWLICKGLVADFELGNILKLDKNGNILRAAHGTRILSRKETIRDYGLHERFPEYDSFVNNGLRSSKRAWMFHETMFDMPCLVAYARMVDDIKTTGLKEDKSTYLCIQKNILDALKDLFIPMDYGSFYKLMRTDLAKYLSPASQQVKDWLKALRTEKRVVFLLTSSYPIFASSVMELMLGSNWRDYFDLIIYGGKKPDFFTKANPFREVIDLKTGEEEVIQLEAGKEYLNGNIDVLQPFLRKVTQKKDPKVVYFGDTLASDAWPCKHYAQWSTVLIAEEMDAEGYEDTVDHNHNPFKKIKKNEHKIQVTPEERDLMVNDIWSSNFYDESAENTSIGMNTAYGFLVSQCTDICVPSIEYLADLPVDHVFTTFSKDPNSCNGFHPSPPKSLLMDEEPQESIAYMNGQA